LVVHGPNAQDREQRLPRRAPVSAAMPALLYLFEAARGTAALGG